MNSHLILVTNINLPPQQGALQDVLSVILTKMCPITWQHSRHISNCQITSIVIVTSTFQELKREQCKIFFV